MRSVKEQAVSISLGPLPCPEASPRGPLSGHPQFHVGVRNARAQLLLSAKYRYITLSCQPQPVIGAVHPLSKSSAA